MNREPLKLPSAGGIDKMSDKKFLRQSGQALVTLLIFISVALIVTTGAIAVSIINLQSTSQFSQGQMAFDLAENGVEDAILKLERNPNLDSSASAYSLLDGNNSTEVMISPAGQSANKTITSRGVVNGHFKRKIEVKGQFNSDGSFSIVSWNEVDD